MIPRVAKIWYRLDGELDDARRHSYRKDTAETWCPSAIELVGEPVLAAEAGLAVSPG